MTEMFGEAWSPMSVPDLAPDDDDDSRAFPPPHLTIISTISLPNLPFYRPPDSLVTS